MAEHAGFRGAGKPSRRAAAGLIGGQPPGDGRLPRVIVSPVTPPYHHPLCKRDVQLVLSSLPASSVAGLRSVSLLGPRLRADGTPVFASYRHTGFLRLHAVATLPWMVTSLEPGLATELGEYGALVEPLADGGSRVIWPGDSLRLYYALGVLLPGLARFRRERDEGVEVEGDVRWLGEQADPWWVTDEALRQWSAVLHGRAGP
jgi:hypothetical protein